MWCSYALMVISQAVLQKRQNLKKFIAAIRCKLIGKQLDAKFVALNFHVMDDALKITLHYFADRVLNERKDHSQDDFQLMNYVDDIDRFRSHPWGRLSWQTVYDSRNNALN